MIDKIISIYNKNYPKEELSAIWQWALTAGVSDTARTELNETAFENLAWNQLITGFWFKITKETVIKLASAVGAIPFHNPEYEHAQHMIVTQPDYKDVTVGELMSLIESKIGFKISIPPFTGNWFLEGSGQISDRHCHYLWILKRITELFPSKNTSIVEVGAGLGILGYYLDKLGYKDYTTFDLAHANAAQTYFLYKNLPERNFILSGDVENPFSPQYRDSLKMLHTSDFKNVPRHRYDIMINMDSLTEMVPSEAEKYAYSDCAPLLLSVNHEANDFSVLNLCKDKRKLLYRYPFWTRDGYVEELYAERE
jgi:putative sugar O-methyltransferase